MRSWRLFSLKWNALKHDLVLNIGINLIWIKWSLNPPISCLHDFFFLFNINHTLESVRHLESSALRWNVGTVHHNLLESNLLDNVHHVHVFSESLPSLLDHLEMSSIKGAAIEACAAWKASWKASTAALEAPCEAPTASFAPFKAISEARETVLHAMARDAGLGEAAKASPVVVATQGQKLAASHSYHSMTFDFVIHIFWQINAVQMCFLL